MAVIVCSACHKAPFYHLRDVFGCLPCFAMTARTKRRARSISSSLSFRPQGWSQDVLPPDGTVGALINKQSHCIVCKFLVVSVAELIIKQLHDMIGNIEPVILTIICKFIPWRFLSPCVISLQQVCRKLFTSLSRNTCSLCRNPVLFLRQLCHGWL